MCLVISHSFSLLSVAVTGIFSGPQPPETDPSDPCTDLLLQMFMSELGPEINDLIPANIPSPSPSPSLTPSLSPPPIPTPTLSPPAQVPTCASPPTVSEARLLPNIDDPFLVSFADLDGLLKESVLFENPTIPSSPDIDNNFVLPFADAHVQDPLLDLSECLPLCSPSLSSPSSSHTPTEQAPDLDSPTSSLRSPPELHELSVCHDHSYTSGQSYEFSTSNIAGKHEASEADSALMPASSAPKKAKIVNDKKYQIRRQKNNVASQASRSKRRARHKDMFSRVKELEVMNARLKEQVQEMEAEAAQLRRSLVLKLST